MCGCACIHIQKALLDMPSLNIVGNRRLCLWPFEYVCNIVGIGNGQHSLISRVIDMAGHFCPTVDMFDMIGHDPCMLKIAAKLHPRN